MKNEKIYPKQDQIYDSDGELTIRLDIYHRYFYGRFKGTKHNGRVYDENDYTPFINALQNDKAFQFEYIEKFKELLNEKYK